LEVFLSLEKVFFEWGAVSNRCLHGCGFPKVFLPNGAPDELTRKINKVVMLSQGVFPGRVWMKMSFAIVPKIMVKPDVNR
jgi:hypothetical protein